MRTFTDGKSCRNFLMNGGSSWSPRVDGRDADRAADDLFHLLQFREELLVGVQDFVGRLVHPLALARELELLLAPIDQQGLEVTFHRPRLLAHRGLGDAVELG